MIGALQLMLCKVYDFILNLVSDPETLLAASAVDALFSLESFDCRHPPPPKKAKAKKDGSEKDVEKASSVIDDSQLSQLLSKACKAGRLNPSDIPDSLLADVARIYAELERVGIVEGVKTAVGVGRHQRLKYLLDPVIALYVNLEDDLKKLFHTRQFHAFYKKLKDFASVSTPLSTFGDFFFNIAESTLFVDAKLLVDEVDLPDEAVAAWRSVELPLSIAGKNMMKALDGISEYGHARATLIWKDLLDVSLAFRTFADN